MIKFDSQYLEKRAGEDFGDFFDLELKKFGFDAAKILNDLRARGQGFYEVIEDENLISEIGKFAGEVKGKFENIVILGIGGSALGAICLNDTFDSKWVNGLEGDVKLKVLDNIDPEFLEAELRVLNLEKSLFLVITKSGGTPETLAQFMYCKDLVERSVENWVEHFVFVTDPQKGALRKYGSELGVKMFEIPENVGGRFSVLSAVGLLPAALVGMDIRALVEGAKLMKASLFSENVSENLPLQLALMQNYFLNDGKTINVMMPYVQRLNKLSDWYKQLLAESVGKIRKIDGKAVGITPVNALGATDQHSQVQLFAEGPDDKFYFMLENLNAASDLQIPYLEIDAGLNYLNGVTFDQLLRTELRATLDALTEKKRPCLLIQLDGVSYENVGALFVLFEGATALLGELMGIDAFDQPGVERGKVLTKEYLLKK